MCGAQPLSGPSVLVISSYLIPLVTLGVGLGQGPPEELCQVLSTHSELTAPGSDGSQGVERREALEGAGVRWAGGVFGGGL